MWAWDNGGDRRVGKKLFDVLFVFHGLLFPVPLLIMRVIKKGCILLADGFSKASQTPVN